MADYGGAYVWDEEGVSDDLAYHFQDHPEHEQLQILEKEMQEWASWFGTAEPNDPNFPWDAFHETGMKLAQRAAKLLKGSPPVCYQAPFEDPKRGRMDAVPIG